MSGMTGGMFGGGGYGPGDFGGGGSLPTVTDPYGGPGSYTGGGMGGGYNPFSSFKPGGGGSPALGPTSSVSGQALGGTTNMIPGVLPQAPVPQSPLSLPMVLQALLQSSRGYGGG